MKRNQEAQCSNCVYWEPRGGDWLGFGYCKRYPPFFPDKVYSEDECVQFFEFSVTAEDDVCGEHPNFLIADDK